MKKLFVFHIADPASGFSMDILRFTPEGLQCNAAGEPDMRPEFRLHPDGKRIRPLDPPDAAWIGITAQPEPVDRTQADVYYVTDDIVKALALLDLIGGALIKPSVPPPEDT